MDHLSLFLGIGLQKVGEGKRADGSRDPTPCLLSGGEAARTFLRTTSLVL